nr:zinc ribbon domain-containing protein [Okeania sp. SIO3I5]
MFDRWFPSSKTCSRCGTVKESLSLSEPVFNCEHCNFSCERDLIRALNLAMGGSESYAPPSANVRDSLWTG